MVGLLAIWLADFFYAMKQKNNKRGRPLAITPERLLATFEEYERYTKGCCKYVGVVVKGDIANLPKERPLTIVGFCVFANLAISTFHAYKSRDEFSDVYTRIRQAIDADQTEGAMLEIYNPTITSRLLGLTEKSAATISVKSIEDMTDAELSTLKEKYESETRSD